MIAPAAWSVAVTVTYGAVLSELTVKTAAAVLMFPAASVNPDVPRAASWSAYRYGVPTAAVTAFPSEAAHTSFQSVPLPLMLVPSQFVAVMSLYSKAVPPAGVSESANKNVMGEASL